MNHPLFSVKKLRKYFPVTAGLLRKQVGLIKAVDGIDITIQKGEIVGMVGESGCGKSTAARSSIRLIEPTSGEIHFDGRNVMEFNSKELKNWRRSVQMVFQNPFSSLNPRKTIAESIGEGLEYHNLVASRQERNDYVVNVLEKVGLTSAALNRYPHAFSGGQQQRICIGRAIALNPSLVVCDEAVSSLDVSVQAQILNLLSKLKEEMGLSYLFIAHDLATVRHFCDKVIVLYLGQVMEEGSADALFNRPQHPYTQALLSAVPPDHPQEKRKRIKLKGEVPSALNPPSGCPFRTRCPYAQPQCALDIPIQTAGEGHTYKCILEPNRDIS
ncbi:MAG: oligopeptide/dipeptide ABC transporter ATP-binding protein [Parachlamydiales bacterium]|jgi:oligopeptide/dipeptide ABC transporter ATP-binding protein